MLNIKLEEIGGDGFITVVSNDKLGRSFFEGSSKFFASNGMVIESYGSNVKMSSRLSKFYIPDTPDTPDGDNCISLSLGCGINKTFLCNLLEAVIEYNSIVCPK